MTLLVRHPLTFPKEREYIYRVILREFLGLDCRLIGEDRRDTLITSAEAGTGQMIVSDGLFSVPKDEWLSPDSLPARPLERWRVSDDLPEAAAVAEEMEVIYGGKLDAVHWLLKDEDGIALGVDVFGSAFFMLTRYEEASIRDRDHHDRFPAKSSLACQEGFLERPIVNEYVEILWLSLKRLWPGLTRKTRSYRLVLTHDVDDVSAVRNQPWLGIGRGVAGDLVKRRDPDLAWRRLKTAVNRSQGSYADDLFNTFDLIMDVSERNGLQSSFYFMSVDSPHYLDGKYKLEDQIVQGILRTIRDRCHIIGFHGSFTSYRDKGKLANEIRKWSDVLNSLLVPCVRGGRQHCLRWENPTTWQDWADAGMEFDSTLGFAERVGFRCGTCYEFPVFNLLTREQLALYEYPLIVMDATLFRYMGIMPGEAVDRVRPLATLCRRYGGNMVVLWHNGSLAQVQYVESYKSLVASLL